MCIENKAEFDEYKLFSQYKKTGDKRIKDEIFSRYSYIAEIMSKRFANRGIDYDDIYQVACVGLLLSVDRFDLDKGIKFASFATPTVMGEIKRYFRDKGCFIKIPRKLYEIFTRAEKLRQGLDPESCSPTELAKLLNISEESVRKAYAVGDMAFIRSLEQEAFGDGSTMYCDTLGCNDKNFLMIENTDFMNWCLEALDEKEQEFIKLRFYKEKTQREISRLWNKSQMQISRYEKNVLKKLRDLYYR